MKKGIVALLVILALVIIVSPGIVGRLAEKSVGENLNWAAEESETLVVSSDKFDRGWFSSEGQHRIQLREGNLRGMLEAMGGAADEDALPTLVISTHLDHGLIPFSSMSREKGSLAPGLGSAVSTLSLVLSDGETIDLPGTIYSNIALGGELQSSYVLEAGSHDENGTTASWGPTEIDITSNALSGDIAFTGRVGTLSFDNGSDSLAMNDLAFSGRQVPTKFGFATGDVKLALEALSVSENGAPAGGLKHLSVDGKTSLDDGRVNGHTVLEMASEAIPMFGEFSVVADIRLEGADAEALGALHAAADALDANAGGEQTLAAIEDDLKRLLASGLEARIDKFDVTLPMGTVTTTLDVTIAEADASTFEWTSLLLGTEGSADISVPEALVDMALQMNPQAGVVVGMGFLRKNGDVYEMNAQYKKGLLTINGAPMPIPLGAFQ